MEEKQQSWWESEKSAVKILTVYLLSALAIGGIVRSCLSIIDPEKKEATLESKIEKAEPSNDINQTIKKENIDYKEIKTEYNPYTN